MLEGTLEGVDGGLLLKTIERYAQWILFMKSNLNQTKVTFTVPSLRPDEQR